MLRRTEGPLGPEPQLGDGARSAPEPPLHADAGSRHPNRRLRVLFINDTSRNGGPGRTLFYILKFLDPAVISRCVIVPREGIVSHLLRDGNVTEELSIEPKIVENIVEPFSRAIRREDFNAHPLLRTFRAAGNVVRAIRGLWSLVRRVKKGRFDVVFCNGTMANIAGGAIAAATGVPVIWHGLYPALPAAIRPIHARLAAGRNVRSIVCVSNATTGLFDHCKHKVRIVHDGIDIEEFDSQATAPILREELGFDVQTVIFGSQGRILRRKGYVEMVHAARIALDLLSEDERGRCRFVVLGDTPDDLCPDHLQQCRDLVRELGLTRDFHFLGYRADVKPYVADFDAAVVPSVYQDPLPRSVMEAMALSKPVIAFDMGGIGEMIDDGISGALLAGAPPDIDGLAKAFVRYFRDSEMRRRHGNAARLRIEKDFDSRNHARALQDEMLRAARA